MLSRSAQEHWEESSERIASGRTFSRWLAQNLPRALALSPEQAARDAEVLAAILRGRLGAVTVGDPLASIPLPAHDPLATRELWEKSLLARHTRRIEPALQPRAPIRTQRAQTVCRRGLRGPFGVWLKSATA